MTRTTDQDWNDDHAADWTPADDDLIRSALMTLRDDVDTVPLPEPAFVRARYGATPRRNRTLLWIASVAAAAVAIAAIAFSQLGRPDAAPVVPAGPDTTASAPTTQPTQPTDEPTPEPTTEAPTTEPTEPTTGPTEGASAPIEPCGAIPGTLNIEGVSEDAAARAMQLMDAALACDSVTLIDLAKADNTELSFGAVSPEDAFAIPAGDEAENRYRLLSTLLTLPPQVDEEFGFYRWPAEPDSDADWQALVDAGVITAEDRDLMEQGGNGYIGYRVVIDAAGQWSAFIGGE